MVMSMKTCLLEICWLGERSEAKDVGWQMKAIVALIRICFSAIPKMWWGGMGKSSLSSYYLFWLLICLDHFIWTKFSGISNAMGELKRFSPKAFCAEKRCTALSQVLQTVSSILEHSAWTLLNLSGRFMCWCYSRRAC